MENSNLRKYVNKAILVNISIIAVLIAILGGLNYAFQRDTIGEYQYKIEAIKKLDSNNDSNNNDNNITFNELKDVNNSLSINKICGFKQLEGTVENKYGNILNNSKLVITNEYYNMFIPLKIIQGTFFDSTIINKGSNVVVISDKAANVLFKSIDVIGSSLKISGKAYKIIGIYKESSSLLYNLSGDGTEKVFIPFSCFDNNTISSVEHLVFSEISNMSDDNNINKIKTQLEDIFGLKMYSYDIIINNNYENLMQYTDFLFFIIGLIAILLFLRVFIKYLIVYLSHIKRKTKDYYFRDIISNDFIHIIKLVLVIVAMLVTIVTVYKLIKFNIYIPYKYVPNDNIFDFEFYIDAIKDNFYSKNMSKVSGFYQNIFNTYQTIIVIVTLLLVILFGNIIVFNRILSHFPKSLFRDTLSYIIAMIIGIIISFIITYFIGLPSYLSFRYILVFLVFVFSTYFRDVDLKV